jgi:hypothetical protein
MNVAKTALRRKTRVTPAGLQRAGALASDFDVESGAAIAAMVGVAVAALVVGIELAAVAALRGGHSLGRLDRRNLLDVRPDRDGHRYRRLQKRSRCERHCRDSSKANLIALHERP